MNLAQKQAVVLDAARHGATARDIYPTYIDAGSLLYGLLNLGFLKRQALDGKVWTYSHTAKGHAAWLESLR